MALSGIVLVHIVAWKIAIVLLATVPILLVAGAIRLRVLFQFHDRHQKQFAKSAAITLEAVENIRMVTSLHSKKPGWRVQRVARVPYHETQKAILHSSL